MDFAEQIWISETVDEGGAGSYWREDKLQLYISCFDLCLKFKIKKIWKEIQWNSPFQLLDRKKMLVTMENM